jgi:citrate lyase subunit beta / citryl-CoA lyase
MPVLRTLLFAPGNRPRLLQKVAHCGADAVILDLEDAVPVAEKVATRAAVRATLRSITSCPVYVRINPLMTRTTFSQAIGEDDLRAVVCTELSGILLPKVEEASDVQHADRLLQDIEQARGLPPGAIDLLPILETARGIHNAYAIAAAGTRVKRLAFGAGDFTRDIGVRWSRREVESQYARSALVIAARAAGIEPPLDSVWVDLHDQHGLVRSTRLAKQLGFQGKMLIHPSQVEPVNAVFSPTPEEIDVAQRIVTAFQQAEQQGAAAIQLDGQFIDYPIVESAQRLLALAAAIPRQVPGEA